MTYSPVAGGTSLLSHARELKPENLGGYFRAGTGASVLRDDGRVFVDWEMGLLSILLGHYNDEIFNAISAALEDGIASLPLGHSLEEDVAKTILRLSGMPDGQVRFVLSGSAACSAAVRIARAITGRDTVVSCYDDQTEVLTEDGFRHFKDLTGAELLATLNRETGRVEYQPILAQIAYPYKGDMIHFRGDMRLDLMVTPEHRVYREKRESGGPRFILEVAEETVTNLRSTPIRMTAAGDWDGEDVEEITIAEVPKKERSKRSFGLTRFPAEAFMRFLGYYVSEGSLVHPRDVVYGIQLAQNPGATQDRMLECICAMGFNPRVYGENSNHIVFHSKELFHALEPLGKAKEKHLPKWAKALSKRLLRILLDAMIEGDGTERVGGGQARKYYSSSRALVDDVCEVALKLGLSTTTLAVRGAGFSPTSCVYHVSISDKNLRHIQPHHVHRVPYDGMVYCVTVPNHLVFVRRNGKTVWSGNSGYHGVDDWALAWTPPAWGVPKTMQGLTVACKYNDLAAIERCFYGLDPSDTDHLNHENTSLSGSKIACVILETETTETPSEGYLQGIRDLCTKHGAALIFDECITAGRYPEFTAWRHYGVEPDMWVTSKVLTNGLPLGAVIGKREWMRGFDLDFRPDYADTGIGPIYISGTHSANGICLAAAAKCLSVWEREDVAKHLEHQGSFLRASLRATIHNFGISHYVSIKGPYYRLLLDAPDLRHKTALMHSLVESGHIVGSGWNLCYAHGDRERESMQEAWVVACRDLQRRIAEDDWTGIGRTVITPYRQA